MDEEKGVADTAICAAFEFLLLLFYQISRPLGLKNRSNLIKYPFLEITKLQFGAKYVVKIPREGTDEVFKCQT